MNSFNQREMPFFAEVDKPRLLPSGDVLACKTYREAVQLCWRERAIRGMTRATLAERSGCNPSHVGDYIHPEGRTRHGAPKRNLPPDRIVGFQQACGCACITQWIAAHTGFTLLEEVLERRAA